MRVVSSEFVKSEDNPLCDGLSRGAGLASLGMAAAPFVDLTSSREAMTLLEVCGRHRLGPDFSEGDFLGLWGQIKQHRFLFPATPCTFLSPLSPLVCPLLFVSQGGPRVKRRRAGDPVPRLPLLNAAAALEARTPRRQPVLRWAAQRRACASPCPPRGAPAPLAPLGAAAAGLPPASPDAAGSPAICGGLRPPPY